MDFILDLLQGAGLAAAIGIRPFLPVLLAGALASADLGIDFDGTDFAFLETWPFLLGALVLVVALDFAGRRAGRDAAERAPLLYALLALALVLGALEAAGSVADRSDEWWVGLGVGAACAALGAAGLSILFPPLAVLVIGGLMWLLAGGRRRAGEKYAGLRILR